MYYEPELGQSSFGQPWQKFEASSLCEAALRLIERELGHVMWNRHQTEYESPFGNTGNRFKNDVFEVQAYSWNEEEQKYNFKWRDIEISWYKYLARGLSSNKDLKPDEIARMLNECLDSLRLFEEETNAMDLQS